MIFVRGDQKAFTFRCFPDMNIQHPYWNLIWVSLSQGSFHQCLLPEATADWQPNFSKEQAGKKGEIWWCWRCERCEAGESWNRWVEGYWGGVGERAAGVIYLTSWCACTNRMQQIIGNITSKTELFHNILWFQAFCSLTMLSTWTQRYVKKESLYWHFFSEK